MICENSSQAKGYIERVGKTLQDRLVKRGSSTLSLILTNVLPRLLSILKTCIGR
ncbi:hypothetical protein PPBDW_I21247 [Photobacterium kishitanii]|nr:hypothetical protein PPBDW_I21247 [Photobacterium kishitanii]